MLPAITSLTPSQILNPIDDFSGAPPGTAVQAASTAGILLTVGALDLLPNSKISVLVLVIN